MHPGYDNISLYVLIIILRLDYDHYPNKWNSMDPLLLN